MPFDGIKTTKIQVNDPSALNHGKYGLHLLGQFQNLCDMRGQVIGSSTVAIPGGPTFTLYVNPVFNVLTIAVPLPESVIVPPQVLGPRTKKVEEETKKHTALAYYFQTDDKGEEWYYLADDDLNITTTCVKGQEVAKLTGNHFDIAYRATWRELYGIPFTGDGFPRGGARPRTDFILTDLVGVSGIGTSPEGPLVIPEGKLAVSMNYEDQLVYPEENHATYSEAGERLFIPGEDELGFWDDEDRRFCLYGKYITALDSSLTYNWNGVDWVPTITGSYSLIYRYYLLNDTETILIASEAEKTGPVTHWSLASYFMAFWNWFEWPVEQPPASNRLIHYALYDEARDTRVLTFHLDGRAYVRALQDGQWTVKTFDEYPMPVGNGDYVYSLRLIEYEEEPIETVKEEV